LSIFLRVFCAELCFPSASNAEHDIRLSALRGNGNATGKEDFLHGQENVSAANVGWCDFAGPVKMPLEVYIAIPKQLFQVDIKAEASKLPGFPGP
jgi:hypothetical protein